MLILFRSLEKDRNIGNGSSIWKDDVNRPSEGSWESDFVVIVEIGFFQGGEWLVSRNVRTLNKFVLDEAENQRQQEIMSQAGLFCDIFDGPPCWFIEEEE